MWKLILNVTSLTDAEISVRTLFAVDMLTPFDATDYAEWAGVNPSDIDVADVQEAQDKQSRLNPGERLIVRLVRA